VCRDGGVIRSARNLVLSHRAMLEREREQTREKVAGGAGGWAGARRNVISRLMDFGAFVDLGGLDGLIHVSQLSWDRVKHPSEVLEAGQRVKVRIEKIDPETGKIGLSYRDLLEDPWEDADRRSSPSDRSCRGR
jgi:ribosomal protein S1